MCASYGVYASVCVSMCAHYSLGSQDRLFPEQDGVEGGWDITVFHKCACDMARSFLCVYVCVLAIACGCQASRGRRGGKRRKPQWIKHTNNSALGGKLLCVMYLKHPRSDLTGFRRCRRR